MSDTWREEELRSQAPAKSVWPRRIVVSLVGFAIWSGIVGLIVGVYARFIEPNRVVVDRVAFELKPRSDKARNGQLRMAFVSDFDMTAPPGRHEYRVLKKVNALNPQVIGIGGDFFGGRQFPSDETMLAFQDWVSEFDAPDGTLVTWGEQELAWGTEKIRPFLPEHVRDIHWSCEIVKTGSARVRLCGQDGLLAPIWVDPERGGRLLASSGRALTIARYRGLAEQPQWDSLDVTASIRLDRAGDGPGIAVLENGEIGYRFRVAQDRFEWHVMKNEGAEWQGSARDKTTFITPRTDYSVRIRVDLIGNAHRVRSRIWPADEREPDDWPINFVDSSSEQPQSGTVGFLAGGYWGGSNRQELKFIEVRDLAGQLLYREDFDSPGRFERDWINPGFRPDQFDATIIVGHNSSMLLDLPGNFIPNASLFLSGHTHGGQVRFPLFGPLILDEAFPRRFSMGKWRLAHGNLTLYTSRGIGCSGQRIRFRCPPEVTDLDISLRIRPPK